MDNYEFAEMWRLMERYTFEIDPGYSRENLSCLLCKRTLIDACHSVCCCQYCSKCITDYIGAGNKYCPGGKSKCREQYLCLDTDIIRDRGMNRKIYDATAKCPNEGCEYEIEMKHMNEHLRKCKIDTAQCPYVAIGCLDNTENTARSITSHMHNDLLIHTKLLIECVNSLKKEVSVLRSEVDFNKRETETLREVVKKKESQIGTLIEQIREQRRETELLKESRFLPGEEQIRAEKVNETAQMIEVSEQLTVQTRKMKYLEDQFEKSEQKTSEIEKQLAQVKSEVLLKWSIFDKEIEKLKVNLVSTNKHIDVHKSEMKRKMVEQFAEKLKEVEYINGEFAKKENQISILKEQLSEINNKLESKLNSVCMKTEILKSNLVDHRSETSAIKNDGLVNNLTKEVKEINKKMDNLILLCPNVKADFIWKIDGWLKKRETMRTTRIFSEPFYSNNYKLCLYLWIDNYGTTLLRCMILRGDNDDEVVWPMRHHVTLSIVDQDTLRSHKSITSQYDSYKSDKSVFDRPKSDMNNAGIGSSALFDFTSVKDKPTIVVNDSLAVSCVLGDPC